ncbi:phosphotransferase family protein [Lacisediminihabitans sp. FW035]
MTTAPGLAAAAIRSGLLHASDVLDGSVAVVPQSRSNVVHRFDRHDVPLVFVKQRGLASRLDGDDAIENERAVLRMLQGRRFAPRLLDAPDPGLWTSAVPGIDLAEFSREPRSLIAAARATGSALAELHQTALAEGCPNAPRPWALAPDSLPPSMATDGSATLHSVLAALTEPVIHAALHVAAANWTTDHLIHGDLSAGNLVVGTPSRGSAALGLTFIDFEAAGRGDPSWDLICAVTMVQSLALDDVTAAAAGDALGEAYHHGGGSGRIESSLACVRALLTAWQVAMAPGWAARQLAMPGPDLDDVTSEVDAWLDRARAHAAERSIGTTVRVVAQ